MNSSVKRRGSDGVAGCGRLPVPPCRALLTRSGVSLPLRPPASVETHNHNQSACKGILVPLATAERISLPSFQFVRGEALSFISTCAASVVLLLTMGRSGEPQIEHKFCGVEKCLSAKQTTSQLNCIKKTALSRAP